MPADPTFTSQVNGALSLLQSANDTYTNTYSTQTSNTASSEEQVKTLQGTVKTLKAKLANIKKVSDTYDREYLDRVSDTPIGGFWRTRGVSTLQDWVLLIFFVMYGVLSLAATVIVFLNSSMGSYKSNTPRTPVFNALMVLGAAFSMGVMITGVLVRFA
jgi:hypothetical protein